MNSLEPILKRKHKSDGKKQPKDDGVRAAQKTLITWLIDEPELYGKVKRFISKKDFLFLSAQALNMYKSW